jgi:dihydropteroate synthase
MTAQNQSIHASINGLDIGDGFPPRIMGVLNVSEESFYKGSIVHDDDILSRARAMIEEGATMIDIGGRSTAPAVAPISIDQERDRVIDALENFLADFEKTDAIVSIDTQFVAVADAAFKVFSRLGKERQFMINDVSGLHADEGMAGWVADAGVPVVLMASHGHPGDSLGIAQTIEDIQSSIVLLEAKGYPTTNNVIIDPAIGHWVTKKDPPFDMDVIRELDRFRVLEKPILVAISRKSFIGAILQEKDPAERLFGSLAATAIAVYNGAHVIRTHDVTKATRDTIAVASAIRTAQF